MKADDIQTHIDDVVHMKIRDAYGDNGRTQILGQIALGVWEIALLLAKLNDKTAKAE